jgi:hypothetical protein
MIYSWAKNLGCTVEHVLYDMSYRNLLLYSAATPQFDDEKGKDKEWNPKLDANNPDNFKPAKTATTDSKDSSKEEEEFIKDI